MKETKNLIVKAVRENLEYTDEIYSQWVLGLSVKKVDKSFDIRVVLKTSESPYVDGMEISNVLVKDDTVFLSDYFENTPDLQGGEVKYALAWLKNLGEVCYIQLDDPLKGEC